MKQGEGPEAEVRWAWLGVLRQEHPESEERQDTGRRWQGWGQSHSALGPVVHGGHLGFSSGGHSKPLEVLSRRLT